MEEKETEVRYIDDGRILNEQGEEITIDDVDLEKGYLKPEEIFVKHQDEETEIPTESHYEVQTFYFTDKSSMEITEPDPHVKWIDNQKGIVEYVDQGEGKTWFGTDLKTVIDVEGRPYTPEYDEYEKIQRYVLYTPEELAQRAKEENFIKTGADRLDDVEVNVDDITLLLAEMIGV